MVRCLHLFISFCIGLTLFELLLRHFWAAWRKTEGYVFVGELLLVGVGMTIATFTLIKLMNHVFGADFCDEKNHLKVSLAVFVSTYIIHSVMFAVLKIWASTYSNMWTRHAFGTEFIFIAIQLIYDFLPLVMIFRQHHVHFSHEDRETTSILMRGTGT